MHNDDDNIVFEEDRRYPGFPKRVRAVCESCPFYWVRTGGMYPDFNTSCSKEREPLFMNFYFFQMSVSPKCVRLLETIVLRQGET